MNQYKIEQKIKTLAYCAVINDGSKSSGFKINDLTFSHWDFSSHDGYIGQSWLVITIVKAANFHEAYNIFLEKLSLVISRISLISQTYINFILEPFLIHKIGNAEAFFITQKTQKDLASCL